MRTNANSVGDVTPIILHQLIELIRSHSDLLYACRNDQMLCEYDMIISNKNIKEKKLKRAA